MMSVRWYWRPEALELEDMNLTAEANELFWAEEVDENTVDLIEQ